MFQQTKDTRQAQVSPPSRPSNRDRRGLLARRAIALAAVLAVVATLASFAVGVGAQSRAETRVAELDQRITLLQLRLDDYLDQADELSARAEARQAANDDARAALDSTEGFLE